ncbi:MAG: DNA polymerase Y family protein [Myxococcota bacterium]
MPALPLQLLLGQRPEWRELPVAVIAEDRPQGAVTWVNARARAHGVLPGQTYATALGLCRELRASVVPPAALGAGVSRVLARLRAFSPNIEPSSEEPGVFWLDASGLVGLWAGLVEWGEAILAALAEAGLEAVLAVGFTRFGSYAAVKSLAVEVDRRGAGAAGPSHEPRDTSHEHEPRDTSHEPEHESPSTRLRVFPTRADERGLADRVPLAYLAVPPLVRERLDRLGVRLLGELVALPTAGILKRYGPEAHRLQRLAKGDLFTPLEPAPEIEPAAGRMLLDFLEHDAHRLLFRTKSLLDALVPIIAARQAVVAELVLDLGFEGATQREKTTFTRHRFRPAAPTLDATLLIDLVRLRLESIDLRAGVVEVRLEAHEIRPRPSRSASSSSARGRTPRPPLRALARVKAELGDGAVVRVAMRDGHLPKARHVFEPFDGELPAPHPTPPAGLDDPSAADDPSDGDATALPPLVRRLHPRAEPMPARPRDFRNDGWPSRDPDRGPIVRMHGPYIVSGGWWQRPGSEVHREYLFAETTRGDLLWIYYDRRRRRWFEEGTVE